MVDQCHDWSDPKALRFKASGYGFEAYASILVPILSNVSSTEIIAALRDGPSMDKYVPLVHASWTNNYLRWKALMPCSVLEDPTMGVNTHERNDWATTDVDHLNAEAVQVYQHAVKTIFDELTKKVLEAGMQQLTIAQ